MPCAKAANANYYKRQVADAASGMNKAIFAAWLQADFPHGGFCKEHNFANRRCPKCSAENKTGKPLRRWRFDFAWTDLKVAIEYEGLMAAKSRHTTIKGFSDDCEKYNEAARLGWKVYRFTAPMLRQGSIIDLIREVLKSARCDA